MRLFSCIFAEDKAALGNLKASFHCARLHYLCMTINKLNFRKYAPHALKGQKLLAQGNALGVMAGNKAPCKGKSLINCLEF